MARSPCRLNVPREVAELVRGLHPEIKRKVRAALERIVLEPYAGKALRDELEGLRSIRVGKFRVIYRLKGERQIDLIAVGPRERIYEETYRLLTRRP